MDRRIFISTLLSLPLVTNARAAVQWQAEFIADGFDGKNYIAGLHISLAKGWKTYWRNPGQTGIPPDIKITGNNIESFSVDFPLPLRIIDGSGEAFGYHDEVVFPISIKPKDPNKPVSAHLASFFGVCAEVCTPAKFEADANFKIGAPQLSFLKEWQMRVPQTSQFIAASRLSEHYLVLELNQPLTDIFVEGPDRYYFGAPDFKKENGKAWIKVAGLKNDKDLLGLELRITADANGQGLEQQVVVA